jgi:hypothetical protein
METPDPHAIVNMLIQIAVHQLTITQDIRTVLQEIRDFTKEQVAINERLEKLLQGLLPPSPNGH